MKKNALTMLPALSLGAASLLMATTASAISFKVDQTDVSVYGYAKLDVIYDIDADLGNAVTRGNIRMDGESGADGHTTFSANESRLGFTTETLVGGHVLKTNVEGDFYGGGGGQFRLRHAYGEWNGFLAGQTWSNFGNVLSLFPTVDFNGPLGQGGGRQAQLRYTAGGFSVSLEDPEVGSGIVNSEATTQHQIPDITVRYQNAAGGVNYAVAGLARSLKYDAEGSTVSNPNLSDDTAAAWAVMLEASTRITDTITVRGSVQPGRAVCKQTVAELIGGISTYTVNPAGCRARIEERPNRAVAVNHVGRITEQHGCCRLAATASNPVVARRANLPDLFQVERRAGGFNHRQEGVYTT